MDLIGGWKLFCSGADPSMSAQVGVRNLTSPRLSDCVSDWIPFRCVPYATNQHQAFVNEVNDALLRVFIIAVAVRLYGLGNQMFKVFNSANSDAISTIHGIVELKFNDGYNPKFALDTATGFLKQKCTINKYSIMH